MNKELEAHKRLLIARFLYVWILLSFVLLFLWMTNMINKKVYSLLWFIITVTMIIYLIKIIR
jgi:hypothetical protein